MAEAATSQAGAEEWASEQSLGPGERVLGYEKPVSTGQFRGCSSASVLGRYQGATAPPAGSGDGDPRRDPRLLAVPSCRSVGLSGSLLRCPAPAIPRPGAAETA
jgi:hypothetical protein